jgi:FkbM family methyltransferase
MKLAFFTRRFSRYENPLMYRLVRKFLKIVYPSKGSDSNSIIAPYSQGFININTGNMHEYELLFHNIYEPAITDLIKRIVKQGDVCLDIGANIGTLTLVMAYAAGPEGKVIAVEPNPAIASRLRENIDLNRVTNCKLIQAAISNKEGTTTLFCAQDDSFHQGWSSLKPSERTPNKIDVDLIRGAALNNEIGKGPLTFVKIDVEGHDFIVFQELHDLISIHRPHLVLEYVKDLWEGHGSNIDEAIHFFNDLQYHIYFIKNDLIFPRETRLPDECDLFCVPRLKEKAS